ncbi:MAG: hypothetical protein ABL967_11380 [Bryobacteraceae bacterium]
MPLKYYVPVSLLFFVGVLALAHYYGVPVLPFAIILFLAETALGFRCSNNKVGDKVAEYVDAVKPHSHGETRQAH